MAVKHEDAWIYAQSMRNSIKIRLAIEMSDLPTPPSVDVYEDVQQYFNHATNEIHLGAFGPVDYLQAADEAEYVSAVQYFYGHEAQHCLSTANEPWAWAVKRCVETLLEYISQKNEATKRRFRSDHDYEYFANHVMRDMGIFVNFNMLYDIGNNLVNMLEDGRIERIRSSQYPAFAAQCAFFRGRDWDIGASLLPEPEELEDPGEMLKLVMNEVRSLAVCQLYTKGFAAKFFGTEVWDIINDLKSDIADGIMATTTRHMAKAAVRLMEKLSPIIFDAVSLKSDEETREFIKALLQFLEKSLHSAIPGNSLSEKDEQHGNGNMPSTFPVSDLMPAAGQESDMTGDNAANATPEGTKENGNDKKADSKHSQKQGSKHGGKAENGENPKSTTANEAAVKEAMEKAAAETRSEAENLVSRVNEAVSHDSGSGKSEVPDRLPPVAPKSVNDICPCFKELKRAYKLSDELPPVLKARGKALRRSNEKYFKSLHTPNVTNLSSGTVDPGLIYGIAIGETDIFRKRGKSKTFDGCAYILLDNSGSMYGNKRTEACKAAAVIEEGFKGLIPVKIVAFDENDFITHEVIKNWDEVTPKNGCWNFCLHGRNGDGNDDAKDIRVAGRELMMRPETKKLLVVLSDGAPLNVEDTKNAIAENRKKGITVNGIYFEDGYIGRDAEDFEYMYEHDYACCELSMLDKVLQKLFYKFSRT